MVSPAGFSYVGVTNTWKLGNKNLENAFGKTMFEKSLFNKISQLQAKNKAVYVRLNGVLWF